MRRKRKNTNHPVKPDRKFNSLTVSLLTNKLMKHGKKAKAINIIDKSASLVTTELKLDFLPVLEQALNQIKPSLETKSKKFGGSNHRVPVKVEEKRSLTLALRWLVEGAREKTGKSMFTKLAGEIIDAYHNRGSAVKRKETVHKEAISNLAFTRNSASLNLSSLTQPNAEQPSQNK